MTLSLEQIDAEFKALARYLPKGVDLVVRDDGRVCVDASDAEWLCPPPSVLEELGHDDGLEYYWRLRSEERGLVEQWSGWPETLEDVRTSFHLAVELYLEEGE